jgi:hypothetical protein
MGDIDLLRQIGHDVPSADAATKQSAREALVVLATAPPVGRRWQRVPIPLPRLAGAVATVALAAVIMFGVLPTVTGPSAAAAALNRVADVAAALPDGPVNGYRHTESEGAYLSGVGGWPDHPNGIWALVPVSSEFWIKPDGSGRLIQSRGEPIWFGPADRAAWQAAGSPDLRSTPYSDTRFGPTPPGVAPRTPQVEPGSLYFQDVASLPTDPGSLRQLIDERAAANGGSTDYERFSIIGDLLRETAAPPKVRAALYRVAAGLTGVELIGSMKDRAGRTGTAVSMTNAQSSRGLEQRVLIFDPRTSALLGEEDILLHKVDWLDADPPMVIGYNIYLVSDIVPTIP